MTINRNKIIGNLSNYDMDFDEDEDRAEAEYEKMLESREYRD